MPPSLRTEPPYTIDRYLHSNTSQANSHLFLEEEVENPEAGLGGLKYGEILVREKDMEMDKEVLL